VPLCARANCRNDGSLTSTMKKDATQKGKVATADAGGSGSAVKVRKRKSMIENYYNIDENFRMLGALAQDPNFRRDVHDWFNLVILVPIVALNVVNWDWKIISTLKMTHPEQVWHGEYFHEFWYLTVFYFVVDLLWVTLIPGTVRSPMTIIIHHSIVILYVMIPYQYPALGWCMGACMSVELNTWFLIARRVLNSKGVNPWRTFEEVTGCSGDMGEIAGLKIKGTSIGFYITWVSIRLILYPALIVPFAKTYIDNSLAMGTYVNLIVVAPVIQVALTCLNIKWSIDLFRSKMKKADPAKGL